MKENILKIRSFEFAVRIINLHKFLKKDHKEFIVSGQLMRSGTGIGAIIREAEYAESLKDFIHKLSIGLKEANESKYWLDLLKTTDFIDQKMYESLSRDCDELLKILISSIKTSKQRIK